MDDLIIYLGELIDTRCLKYELTLYNYDLNNIKN